MNVVAEVASSVERDEADAHVAARARVPRQRSEMFVTSVSDDPHITVTTVAKPSHVSSCSGE